MELRTLSRNFLPVDIIEGFESVIWTERYYGDSEVQLVVPATPINIQKLAMGTFLSFDKSSEVMILETHDIKDHKATITGISLLKWLNNRFVRFTVSHEDRYYNAYGLPAGYLLWYILNAMVASPDPAYATYPAGIPNPGRFKIYNIEPTHIDPSGPNVNVAVSYGPLYDVLNTIATTYEIGMSLTLEEATTAGYRLGFRSYRGVDHTSNQNVNSVIRFSPEMESFTDIKEFQSIADYKTEIYTFIPSNPDSLATIPGYAWFNLNTGFDLRVEMVFEEDITTDAVGGDPAVLLNLLIQRAFESLLTHKFVKIIDGEIVPTGQFKYGIDYNLGDIVEVQGHSGMIQAARVVEYIRSQDSVGEKAYPTLEMIG